MSARALTIRQPHASLIAVGAKHIETRGKPTSYRGPLLIHAAKVTPEIASRVGTYAVGHHRLTFPGGRVDEGYTLTETVGRQSPMGGAREHDTWPLPLGAVVASCQLVGCVRIVDGESEIGNATVVLAREHTLLLWREGQSIRDAEDVTEQRPFGDFSPGRYAWLLGDVKPTTERCPRCGGSGRYPDERAEARRSFGYPQDWRACETCDGSGHCAPVPMRGRQGLWTPEW